MTTTSATFSARALRDGYAALSGENNREKTTCKSIC